MRIIKFIIIITSVNISLLQAQQYYIKGNVKDAETGAPLSYTNIRVDGTTYGTSANKNGEYEIKLRGDNYTLIASYIGYTSDTIRIDLNRNLANINFILISSSVKLQEVIIKPGVNPALEIIRKAIERRKERYAKLNNYSYFAYTKGLIKSRHDIIAGNNRIGITTGGDDSSSLKITGILENESEGYFEKPDNYKEIILARKQSANFPPTINILTGGRFIQNFYDENVNFLGLDLPGPLSNDALNYYDYYIVKTHAMNNNTVYQISMSPIDPADPGFKGNIYINDKSFDLIKVDLQLNRAANVGGIFDTIDVFQQFSMYDDSIYMPVDYRLIAGVNYLNIVKFGFEFYTIMYNYSINPKLDENIFNKAVVTVLPDADKKDSLYWRNSTTIPNTKEELNAYKRIDSLESVPKTFWDRFSPLSSRIYFSDDFSVSAPLAMYHFNRIEGSAIDLGLYFKNLSNKRLGASLKTSYGFSDKKLKEEFDFSYLMGSYRTYKLTFNVFNKLKILFDNEQPTDELVNTLWSLFAKEDFRNYYYSKGFNIKIEGEVFPILSLNIGFLNQTDNSAFVNTNFSFFSKHKSFNPNPEIYNTKTNAITAGFKFDFRDYIEDGLYRRRVNLSRDQIFIEGEITHSDKNLLKSTSEFTTCKGWISGSLATFQFSELDFKLFGMYNFNKLPYQMFYSIPGSIDFLFNNLSFRTFNMDEIIGDRVVTLNLQHDWGNNIFKWLHIPLLKDSDLQLNTFLNSAFSDISKESLSIISPDTLVKTFKHPFYEIGFGIYHILFPIELDFAWKLNYRGVNNFRIGISSFLY
jgi:Family of unknown function (DUF5686)/CarboxypepD_reg-like domain